MTFYSVGMGSEWLTGYLSSHCMRTRGLTRFDDPVSKAQANPLEVLLQTTRSQVSILSLSLGRPPATIKHHLEIRLVRVNLKGKFREFCPIYGPQDSKLLNMYRYRKKVLK